MKKNKAITLIALIVTIIVLLILVGVSITMLSGDNGILSKAKIAKENSDSAEVEEQNKLGQTNDVMDKYTTSRGSVTLSQEQYDSILSRLDSLEVSSSNTLSKNKLWEGDINQVGQTMSLIDSIENYKFILINYRWSTGTARELRWLSVDDVLSVGYSSVNPHILITPYDNCYADVSFTANNTAIVSYQNGGNVVHIVGIYGIK